MPGMLADGAAVAAGGLREPPPRNLALRAGVPGLGPVRPLRLNPGPHPADAPRTIDYGRPMGTSPAISVDRLRDVAVLGGLAEEDLERIVAAGRERRIAAGEFLFHQGERATLFHIVLEGQLETTREVAGEQVLLMSHGPGGFLGAMALLTETPYRGTTFAVADTHLFELDGEELRRLAFAHPPMLRRFLPAFETVSSAVKGIERDREKLLAVGKLAAGLAHELNNPAAAARRAAQQMTEALDVLSSTIARFVDSGMEREQAEGLVALQQRAVAHSASCSALDALDAADAEEDLIARLEAVFPCTSMAGYGLTETGPVATSARDKSTLRHPSEEERLRHRAMAGWPLPGCALR